MMNSPTSAEMSKFRQDNYVRTWSVQLLAGLLANPRHAEGNPDDLVLDSVQLAAKLHRLLCEFEQ